MVARLTPLNIGKLTVVPSEMGVPLVLKHRRHTALHLFAHAAAAQPSKAAFSRARSNSCPSLAAQSFFAAVSSRAADAKKPLDLWISSYQDKVYYEEMVKLYQKKLARMTAPELDAEMAGLLGLREVLGTLHQDHVEYRGPDA